MNFSTSTRMLLLAVVLYTGVACEKTNSGKHYLPHKQCEVQQFNSYHQQFHPEVPYLFRKSYDHSGSVSEIDAYFWGIISVPLHVRARVRQKGPTIYLMDAERVNDTVMVIWLNPKGRPIRAEEYPGFYKGRAFPFDPHFRPIKYSFTYDANQRLWMIESFFPGFTLVDTCKYDSKGNIVSRLHEPTNLQGDRYRYDYSREPVQQFYMEMQDLNSFIPGFRLMEYMQFFPELTSPPNVRIDHFVGLAVPPFHGSFLQLYQHQFDNGGKLVSYKLSFDSTLGSGVTNQIIWRCDKKSEPPAH